MENKREDENFEFLAADDPLMADLQEEYANQLIRNQANLELELKEILAKRNKVHKDKEETGVRLYGAQQQLAENQMTYQKAHDNYNIIQKLRIQSEQKLAQINETYNSKKQQIFTLKSKVTKAQKQLENLMKHYHEIEAYNIQLKSDIAVTRTETFTAQQNVANLEKLKKKQDVLIDSMNQEIKRLEEQKNIMGAQLVSQKEQTEEARKVLKDAQLEMEKIIASKKNLLERWQKSLAVMQKMDETLQTLKDSHKDQREANILLVTELNGIKSEIRKQEGRTEKAVGHSNRLGTEKHSLQIKKNQLNADQEKILQQLSLLQNSLNNTEEEIKKTDNQKKQIDDSMNLIETNIMKLHTQTKKLLEDLINQKGEHTAIEKTASNLLKQARMISLEIEQKEVELQNLMNEIARVRIDQLNTKSQIQLLQSKKQEIIKQRVDKEVLVATYEIQIRQGHDLNEKKQHEVGRLNKLHDELVNSANDETKSPLQNKLINLTRETQELEVNCNELYRDWIKKQTILVHENNKLQELGDTVSSLETKKTILQQKKSRLNNNYKAFEKQITTIQINLKGLQNDMNKLNDGLAVHYEKKDKLENENVNIESEFGQKLKDLQRESVQLEVSIDSLREQKAQLLNEIIECERQILLWERKYQLQKEMQQALDPNVGQSQIQELKKEIHRMELKYESIKKAQDEISIEMLRAAKKKESIQLKYAKKPEPQKIKKEPETSNQIQKVMELAKFNYTKTIKNVQEVEKNLDRKKQQLEKMSAVIEQTTEKYSRLENENHEIENNLLMAKTQKLLTILKVSSLQARYKKYDEMMNKAAKLMFQQPVLRNKLSQMVQKNNVIYQVIEDIGTKFPQYKQILDSVIEVGRVN